MEAAVKMAFMTPVFRLWDASMYLAGFHAVFGFSYYFLQVSDREDGHICADAATGRQRCSAGNNAVLGLMLLSSAIVDAAWLRLWPADWRFACLWGW